MNNALERVHGVLRDVDVCFTHQGYHVSASDRLYFAGSLSTKTPHMTCNKFLHACIVGIIYGLLNET